LGGRLHGVLSEGQLLATVLHSIFLGDRPSVLVRWRGENADLGHISRAKSFVSIFEIAGFPVRKKFESPITSPRAGLEHLMEYRVKRPSPIDFVRIVRDQPILVANQTSLLSSLVRLFVVASVVRDDQYVVSATTEYRDSFLRHLGQLASSLGFQLRSFHADERLDLRFERALKPTIP